MSGPNRAEEIYAVADRGSAPELLWARDYEILTLDEAGRDPVGGLRKFKGSFE